MRTDRSAKPTCRLRCRGRGSGRLLRRSLMTWLFYRLSLLRQTQDLLFFTTQSQTFIKACPIFTFQLTYAPVLSLTFNLVEMTFFLILDTHKHQIMRAKESERLFILRFPIQRFGNLTIVLRRIGYTLYSFCAVNSVNMFTEFEYIT